MPLPPLLAELTSLFGPERCLTKPAHLLAYECDGLTHFKVRPAAVVLPENREEVASAVRACVRHRTSFTPRGAGTGLSGGAVPAEGGILIEVARMKRILEIDAENRLAVCEPGVVNSDLSRAVQHLGLAYAPDPSSQQVCTLGGNVAENSGGPHCLKYGATSNHILAVEVVMPDGSITEFGSKTGRAHGIDLRGLFVGSEGTLGIVTKLTCRLLPIAKKTETLLASFRELTAACGAVSDIIASGIVPSALEALDERTIAAVESSVYRAGYPEGAGAVLLIELDGHPAQVKSDRAAVEKILKAHAPLQVEAAATPEQRAKLWKGRKGAFGAMGRLAPDLYVQDAVVPRSRLPEVLPKICAVCDELGLVLANVFHAGEGNLHPNICYDGRKAEDVEKVVLAGQRIMQICIDAGGALSGEHGIGLEKQEFMPLVFSDDDLETMRRVRSTFSPDGLINPGKILPTPRTCVEVRMRARKGTSA